MSSHQQAKTKKRTVAQVQAEKEQRLQDYERGKQLTEDVARVLDRYDNEASSREERVDAINALLAKAIRAGSSSSIILLRTLSLAFFPSTSKLGSMAI